MRIRALVLLLLLAFAVPAAPATSSAARPEFVEAVEFPYYLYPRTLWERELVWIKNLGIRTVQFSIPWNWHQLQPGEYDFTGRTSPRRDLIGLVRILRRLGLQAWIRPLPPVRGWMNNGLPAGAPPDAGSQRAWLKELYDLLGTQTADHGGPIAFVDGRISGLSAAPAPSPVISVSVLEPSALKRAREALAGWPSGARGSLVWTDLEDALYPAGWAANPAVRFHAGAVGLDGEERGSIAALRRNAALRNWIPLLGRLRPIPLPKQGGAGLPKGVTASQLRSPLASVVAVVNSGQASFRGELRVQAPGSKRTLVIPAVSVRSGDSLWLPVGVSLGPGGLCRDCSNFSPDEHIVYATAELLSVEYENGILAMEFAAPEDGEAVLQLARKPVGQYLAAGKLQEFDWDEKTLRARLPIPASAAAANRVRVGIAMEEPETSAFFNDARRLMLGRANVISTSYSSADLANRSRLRLPAGFTARRIAKSANEIDYEITSPADAIHGDYANLTLEADGMPLGRARLQMLRPVTLRLEAAVAERVGDDLELPVFPPTITADARTGANIAVVIRNNSPDIQTYHLEAAGDRLEFFPQKTDIAVGAMSERTFSLRVFGPGEAVGLHEARLRLSGGATLDEPVRVLFLPRNRTLAWTADLDGDGAAEWILESRRARAVFSSQDRGRWMEFTWKESGANYLPEQGVFAGQGAAEVRLAGDTLEFAGKDWKRTVKLEDARLTVEQSTPLPTGQPIPAKRAGVELSIERPSASQAVFKLQ